MSARWSNVVSFVFYAYVYGRSKLYLNQCDIPRKSLHSAKDVPVSFPSVPQLGQQVQVIKKGPALRSGDGTVFATTDFTHSSVVCTLSKLEVRATIKEGAASRSKTKRPLGPTDYSP